MSEDRPYVEENTQERERMRAIVERVSDDELRISVNPHWTVAAVLGHIAFWDARVLSLADKLERGEPFTSSDTEPEDVDWINDASRELIHAIPPREAARLALEIAEETDATVSGRPTPTARSTRCARRTEASISMRSRPRCPSRPKGDAPKN
jgi:DinB superfamily